MGSIPANSSETWSLLVVSRDGNRILLHQDRAGSRLPRVDIPIHGRTAANLNRAIQRDFKIPVISLYPIVPANNDRVDGDRYHAVAALAAHAHLPAGCKWRLLSSLSQGPTLRPLDVEAIAMFRTELARKEHKSRSAPFLQPDWFTDVTRWITEILLSHALRLTGPFEQFNADSLFSLIRFETCGPAVWFKAVGAGNSRELPVTLALTRLCPAHLPKILACKPDWNAWLAEETSGVSLADRREPRLWNDAAAALAQLQMASIRASGEVCSAGARDFGHASLGSLVESFFAALTASQVFPPADVGDALTREQVEETREGVQDSITSLEALGLPDTIGHMDLNPSNIHLTEARCVFLDWAEAFVGNPFLSFEYLRQHFRRAISPGPSEENRFREAYLGPWQRLLSPEDLQAAISCVPLAALFAYTATIWAESIRRGGLNVTQGNYLASLIRKMRRIVLNSRAEGVCL
jgi:Phosphotransferase enzyme family